MANFKATCMLDCTWSFNVEDTVIEYFDWIICGREAEEAIDCALEGMMNCDREGIEYPPDEIYGQMRQTLINAIRERLAPILED